jgi:hypothetical protein
MLGNLFKDYVLNVEAQLFLEFPLPADVLCQDNTLSDLMQLSFMPIQITC